MKFTLFPFLFLWVPALFAQDTLRIDRSKAEALFLKNNLDLIAQKLQIESKKAKIIQARHWPNPTFSIGEINAWATEQQTGGELVSPPFWNNFGRNQQIAFEFEQLVRTAGKRQKLIGIAELDASISEAYFRDLLRGLKFELRTQMTDLQYLQQSRSVHQNLLHALGPLTAFRANQYAKGHISQQEFVRLRAMEMEIRHTALHIDNQKAAVRKKIQLLLRIPPTVPLHLNEDDFIPDTKPYTTLLIEQLLETAQANRPDYHAAQLKKKYRHERLSYERAQRIPDLTFQVNYDRNGNTMLDFIGFGLSFDLPVFDRNRGNIQRARVQVERAKTETEKTILSMEHEVQSAYTNLLRYIEFAGYVEKDFDSLLDGLLKSNITNFRERRINLLEFIDFLHTYLENKNRILETQQAINHHIEELHFSLGSDLQF